jgi:hypothetical protein
MILPPLVGISVFVSIGEESVVVVVVVAVRRVDRDEDDVDDDAVDKPDDIFSFLFVGVGIVEVLVEVINKSARANAAAPGNVLFVAAAVVDLVDDNLL